VHCDQASYATSSKLTIPNPPSLPSSLPLFRARFVAHALGWWGKMVMFRDWGVCWLLSVGFEILECSLQFIIPEFKECWWDSLLIDLLGANLLGMAAGWVTLQVRRKGRGG